MQYRQSTHDTPLRRAEIVAALSLATDLGTGVPVKSMLRVALFAVHLAEAHKASDADLLTSYYLPLLALTGCTAEAPYSSWHVEPQDGGAVVKWTTEVEGRGIISLLSPLLRNGIRQGQLKDLAKLKSLLEQNN